MFYNLWETAISRRKIRVMIINAISDIDVPIAGRSENWITDSVGTDGTRSIRSAIHPSEDAVSTAVEVVYGAVEGRDRIAIPSVTCDAVVWNGSTE